MNNRIVAFYFATALTVLVSGCVMEKLKVGPGELKKLYAPSGLYADLFVDPIDPESSSIMITSEDHEAPQMSLYFDELNAERILMIDGEKSVVIDIDGSISDPKSYTFKILERSESMRTLSEYRLELVNPSQNDEQVAAGNVR